jgi:hypothetical protein
VHRDTTKDTLVDGVPRQLESCCQQFGFDVFKHQFTTTRDE